MTVVRYTFDVCIRRKSDMDVYTLAHKLEESIMKTPFVCGCEVKGIHSLRVNSVDVDRAITIQQDKNKTIEELT
jgi:hypothetical protein